jgi:hypothetical protein
MIYGFRVKHRGVWPVRWMCEMLDVSPSGFYEWLRRAPSKRAREDMQVLAQLRASFAGSDETYGASKCPSTRSKSLRPYCHINALTNRPLCTLITRDAGRQN